ncbi:MAG TPA: hypothetical protein VFY40_02180 [Blastocatellia bacterium]|nr:hypothetical protein [Blastocatellia bacterium]
MEAVTLIGAVAAAAGAGVGLGAALRLLPVTFTAHKDLGDYAQSDEARREKRLAVAEKNRRLVSHPDGSERQSSIIGLGGGLDGATIRHKDGSFSRFYEFALEETMLGPDSAADICCDDIARLLCLPLPKDTLFQFRYAVSPDPGLAIGDHLRARSYDSAHYPSARLHDSRLDFYRRLAAGGMYRRERALLAVRAPSPLKSDQYTTFWNTFAPELAREIGKRGVGDLTVALRSAYRRSKRDATLRRLEEEEREARARAEKYFRLIELHAGSRLRSMERRETWEALFHSHCLDRDQAPALPREPGLDISRYLTAEEIKDRSWYVMHGRTPVTMVSLFAPPNPGIYADTLRAALANPDLAFRHTLVCEYVALDKFEAKQALGKRIKQVQVAKDGFKLSRRDRTDHDAEKALADLDRVLYDISGATETLVNCRFYALVYGEKSRSHSELAASLERLEDRCEKLIRALQAMDGAEAAREEAAALRSLYERALVGEADPSPTGREILEVASSLAALAPRERAFKGSPRPHTILSTASGRLVGLDLFDKSLLRAPTVLALGAPGSGKTTLVALLINDALASVADLRVSALDNGGSLAPWAEVIGARYLRLSSDDDRTFNIYDYPGLLEGEKPDESDIALVVMDAMLLSGYSLDDRDTADLIAHSARTLLERRADRNAVDEEKDEPTLKDLVFQLENYPDKHEELKAHAARIATRLKKYVGNKWLDAPTHPDFKQDTRCDVYELASLDGFSPDVRRALANRMAARVLRANCLRRADGTKVPSIQAFVEVWKIVTDYPDLLKVIRQGGRTGRRDNVVTLLDTHTYDELKEIHDIAATAGLKFIGPQNKNFDSLIRDAQLNNRAVAAVNSIRNIDGVCTQWVMVAGSGQAQQVEMVQADLSPAEFWTWANNPHEFNARQRVLSLRPGWTMTDAVAWLAQVYPRGLAAEGLVGIDESLLS